MRCEEFQRRMNRLLDNRRDPESDWALISHAGDCAACRHQLNGQQALAEAMEWFVPPGLPGTFAEDVVSLSVQKQVSPSRPSHPRRVRALEPGRFRFVVAAVAAVLLVGCTLVAFVSSTPSNSGGERFSLLARVSKVPRAEPSKQGRLSKQPAAAPPVHPHESTSPSTVQPEESQRAALFSALAPLTSLPSIESNEIPGVRPLVTSFDVTISLLKRTIPRHSSSARKQPATSQVCGIWPHIA